VKKFIKRVDYSREEIALILYYKGLEDTDCGISASGQAEENAGRNSVLSNSKKNLCITTDSLRDVEWLHFFDLLQTIKIVLPNTIHGCKRKNFKHL